MSLALGNTENRPLCYAIYNVGKIKADNIPNGNIVSAIGSKADMSSADNRVAQKPPTVKNKYMQESEKNSSEEFFSVGSQEYTTRMNELTEQFKDGSITLEQFTDGIKELVENEHKATAELQQAMDEVEEKHYQYMIDSARYANQLKKKNKRLEKQLKEGRSESVRGNT